MNRIQQFAEPFAMPPALCSATCVDEKSFNGADLGGSHTFFTPLHYEANYAYPLIVWLHGPADDERQLRRIMPLVSMRNYVGVAPRGTLGDPITPGYGWSQSDDHILLAEHRVLAAIDAARQRFNISDGRIYLAGFDCGGSMALRFALNHPQLVAGVISLGGAFPRGRNPLGRLLEVRRLQVLLATGRESNNYAPDTVCEDLRLCYAAGMTISLRQYPCADELTTQMLSDTDRWIMEQVASNSPCEQDRSGSQARNRD